MNIILRDWTVLAGMLLLLLPGSLLYADGRGQVFESVPDKVALLELYTSEGCSSCPPADAFVSALKDAGLYPKHVIPLSFHVTYWDYIGWHDLFAQDMFDRRQRQLAARRKNPTVYTPQLVLDGQDVRATGTFRTRLRALNQNRPQATIKMTMKHTGADTLGLDLDILVPDQQDRVNATVFVALFENRLSSRVNAGENNGRTLRHDYVVRRFVGPLALADAGPDSQHSLEIDIPETVRREHAGVAVFVQNSVDGSVLQALSAQLIP